MRATGLILACLPLAACNTDAGESFVQAVESSQANLESLQITALESILETGSQRQLTATAATSDGGTIDYTDKVVWSSNNPRIAGISQSGLLSAGEDGMAIIAAKFAQLTATFEISVSSAALSEINLTATDATPDECQSTSLSALGTYEDGSVRNISDLVNWSSGNASLADFSAEPEQKGLLRTFTAGSVTVNANYRSIDGILAVEIADSLEGFTLTPATLTISEDDSFKFEAYGLYSGSTVNISNNTRWTLSAQSASSIASVDDTVPGKGTLTANNAGTAILSASCGGLMEQATVTVTAPVELSSIEIYGGTNPLTITTDDDLTLYLTATYTDGTSEDVTDSASWSIISGDSNVIAIDSSGSDRGQISYTGTGTVLVEAEYDGLLAQFRLNVESP